MYAGELYVPLKHAHRRSPIEARLLGGKTVHPPLYALGFAVRGSINLHLRLVFNTDFCVATSQHAAVVRRRYGDGGAAVVEEEGN